MASLQIIKNSEGYFSFVLDGDESKAVIDNSPNTTSFGSIFHFKTKNGAPIFAKQNISFLDVTYTDIADVDFTFVSAHALWVKLIDEEFFKGLNQGGGGGGSTTFQGLDDTFDFFGNDGKVPVVNLAENRLDPVKLYNYKDFIQLEDVAIAELVENKILSVAMVGAELKIVLSDPPTEPEQLANAIGFFNIADLSTQTVPLAYTTGDLILTNDNSGSGSTSLYRPFGVSSIFNTDTNRFDFNELSLGDEILLRVHLFVTTTAANQVVKVDMVIGEGTADELRFRIADREYKSIVTDEPLNDSMPFFIGTELRRTAPGKLIFYSDDNASIKVSSFYPTIIRKDVNVINITVEEDPEADHYRGTWNATTNTPTLANGIGKKGDWYKVSVAGSYFGVSWSVGDSLFYNGTDWVLRANNNQSLTSTVTSLSSSSLSSQDATGLKNYINALVSPFTVASTEELFFVITESNQVFKLKLRGRSFGGSEPDITETDLIELNNSFFNIKFRGDRYEHQATGGALSSFGFGAPTTVGSASNVAANFASSYSDSPRTSWNHRISNTTAVAGTIAEFYQTTYQVSNELGFYFSGKVAFNTSANARGIVGLSNSVLALTNVNPSSLANIIAFGFDDTDDNLQIMHNDSSGLATKVDTLIDLDKGNALPSANLRERDFVIEIFNFKGSANVFFKVLSLRTGKKFFHVATTNLPSVTTGLTFRFFICNNTDASVASVIFSNILIQRES